MNTFQYQEFESIRPRRNLLRKTVAYLRDNLLVCLLGALFLIGMLLGALLLRSANSQIRDLLRVLMGGFLEKRSNGSFAALAASSFSSTAILLLILFFCGFCTISQPVILLLLVFRGLGYGFSIGGFYAEKGIQAAGYVFTLLFPPMILGALLLLVAARTSFLLSVRLLRTAMAPSDWDEKSRMRRYCVRYFLYVVLGVLIALLDAALTCRFGAALLLP